MWWSCFVRLTPDISMVLVTQKTLVTWDSPFSTVLVAQPWLNTSRGRDLTDTIHPVVRHCVWLKTLPWSVPESLLKVPSLFLHLFSRFSSRCFKAAVHSWQHCFSVNCMQSSCSRHGVISIPLLFLVASADTTLLFNFSLLKGTVGIRVSVI